MLHGKISDFAAHDYHDYYDVHHYVHYHYDDPNYWYPGPYS